MKEYGGSSSAAAGTASLGDLLKEQMKGDKE